MSKFTRFGLDSFGDLFQCFCFRQWLLGHFWELTLSGHQVTLNFDLKPDAAIHIANQSPINRLMSRADTRLQVYAQFVTPRQEVRQVPAGHRPINGSRTRPNICQGSMQDTFNYD